MTFCYILKLESNKYYVGKTENIEQRMIDHYSGQGSKWTQLYSPIEILEIFPFIHKWQESYITLITMKKYGIENVRGGPWCMINMIFQPRLYLLDESKSIQENYILYSKEVVISNKIPSKITSFNIYIIKSSNNKYYITSNNNITDSKFFGDATIDNISLLKENSNNRREIYAYTIFYMFKYGIDNVRGGGITTLNLSFDSKIRYQNYFKELNENSTLIDILKIVN